MKTGRTRTFVFDLDGVLANTEHRLHLMDQGPDVFFRDMEKDEPIEATVNILLNLERSTNKIIILTGRPERFRAPTSDWLWDFGISHDELIMRPDGSPLTVMDYKVGIIKDLSETHYIMAVVEDNPETARYLREHTFAPVLLVSSGYYDPAGFGHDPREDKRW